MEAKTFREIKLKKNEKKKTENTESGMEWNGIA